VPSVAGPGRVTDPPAPSDGTCLVCGRERAVAKLKPLYRRALERDPFCSTDCCRAWHGTQLPVTGREDFNARRPDRDGLGRPV